MGFDGSGKLLTCNGPERIACGFASLAIHLMVSAAVCQNVTDDTESQLGMRFQFMQDGLSQWAVAEDQRRFSKLRLTIDGREQLPPEQKQYGNEYETNQRNPSAQLQGWMDVVEE